MVERHHRGVPTRRDAFNICGISQIQPAHVASRNYLRAAGRHVIGLFSLQVWLEVFREYGFEVVQERLDHLYDQFILGEGEYLLRMFICVKV